MRLGDTHWGSHYVSLLNIIIMFSSIMNVLEGIERTTLIKILKKKKKMETHCLLEQLESFDFIFYIHFRVAILGITNKLNFPL